MDTSTYFTYATTADTVKQLMKRKVNKILIVSFEKHNLTSEHFIQKASISVDFFHKNVVIFRNLLV